MEVDVVQAAMQSIVSVIRTLVFALMMISDPSIECGWLRKRELDLHTQFHCRYLSHVDFYVTQRKPPTPAPTKQTPNATYRIASRRGVVDESPDPQQQKKKSEEASRRSVVVKHTETQNQRKKFEEGSRRSAGVEPTDAQNQKTNYEDNIEPVNASAGVEPTDAQNQKTNYEDTIEPVNANHQKTNYEDTTRRGVVVESTDSHRGRGVVEALDPHQQMKNYGKSQGKDAEKLAASSARRSLETLAHH
jgi:hypothetical protein